MKQHLAIVTVDSNRVSKYKDFDAAEDADAHVTAYGGTSYDNVGQALIGDIHVQGNTVTIVENPVRIATLKRKLMASFQREGVTRITAQVPAWDDISTIKVIASIWNMLGAPSPAQSLAKDIYLYVRNTAKSKVNAMTSVAQIMGVDPMVSDPFGDGTNWPE